MSSAAFLMLRKPEQMAFLHDANILDQSQPLHRIFDQGFRRLIQLNDR